MENAWVRIASSVQAWPGALLGFKRLTAEVRTLEAMRTQALSDQTAICE
jgi:hypothetical protein